MAEERSGRLRGGGIRVLPAHRVDNMLARIKIEGSGKKRRVRQVRYRVTALRDPDGTGWIRRNPRNGQYYRISRGQHRTQVRPTGDMLRRTNMISLEVEVDRGGIEPKIYNVSVPGL